jgi:hypothetical protein
MMLFRPVNQGDKLLFILGLNYRIRDRIPQKRFDKAREGRDIMAIEFTFCLVE